MKIPSDFNPNLFLPYVTPTDRDRLKEPAEVLAYFDIKPGSVTPQEAGDAVYAATGDGNAAETVAWAVDHAPRF